jgi:hypothetical protein
VFSALIAHGQTMGWLEASSFDEAGMRQQLERKWLIDSDSKSGGKDIATDEAQHTDVNAAGVAVVPGPIKLGHEPNQWDKRAFVEQQMYLFEMWKRNRSDLLPSEMVSLASIRVIPCFRRPTRPRP